VTQRSIFFAPSSNKSSDISTRGSWAPVVDGSVNTDGLDDSSGVNPNHDVISSNATRSNNSFQKHLSSTTPNKQSSKMIRTAYIEEDTDAFPTAHRTRPNTHTSPSSSSKPLDGNCAAQGDYAAFYENQNIGAQMNEEQATSAALEESFNGMLMAWYQSGYATGRYQALLEQSRKSSNSQSHSQYRNQPPLQPQPQCQGQGQHQNNKYQPYEPQTSSHPRSSQSHPPHPPSHPPRGDHS
jgi:Survival motor neuron protein (SMN)